MPMVGSLNQSESSKGVCNAHNCVCNTCQEGMLNASNLIGCGGEPEPIRIL